MVERDLIESIHQQITRQRSSISTPDESVYAVDVDGKKPHHKFLIGCLICIPEEWTDISTSVMTHESG